MGVGKRDREPLSERQWENWIGSGKMWFIIIEGKQMFDEAHIREIGARYIESKGRAYSIYHYDRSSGRFIELINTYQCAQMWGVGDRQATNRIVSGGIPHQRLGNEYFVERETAEHYQATQRSPSSAAPTRPGICL